MPSLRSCWAQHNFTTGKWGTMAFVEQITGNKNKSKHPQNKIWQILERMCGEREPVLCHSVAMLYHYTATVNFKSVHTSSSLVSLPALHVWMYFDLSLSRFYYSGVFLSDLMHTPYLIYRGGERYKGTAYKITAWWLLLLTRLLALVWCYLFFKWLIYWDVFHSLGSSRGF